MIRRMISLSVVALALAACKSSGGGGAVSASACVNGKIDLTKVTGDWIGSASFREPEGVYTGDQYRIRFDGPPAADGTLKAKLAFRLDIRSYTGKYYANAQGGVIDLTE